MAYFVAFLKFLCYTVPAKRVPVHFFIKTEKKSCKNFGVEQIRSSIKVLRAEFLSSAVEIVSVVQKRA